MYTAVNFNNFTIQKWGSRGCKLHGQVSMMDCPERFQKVLHVIYKLTLRGEYDYNVKSANQMLKHVLFHARTRRTCFCYDNMYL